MSRATRAIDRSSRSPSARTADFNVTAVVGTEGCSGIVENAVGVADGDMLKAEGKQDNETCVLVLYRRKKGVSLEEAGNCTYFHGASCEFSGDYRKKR